MNWTLESSNIISEKPKLRYGGGVAIIENKLFLFGGAWNTGMHNFNHYARGLA
jgi:hypothetical protein